LGEGRSYGKEKKQITYVRGLSDFSLAQGDGITTHGSRV
jgi:hypothetical protein